ncbi:MAG: helix-turn-helix transcriptional regulator [Candidatus Eremiobacteraeota bacterium]|nr:helix-turn-helix transcriptional regulator [Candidatus Eremiobacteraeota bacterium]
MMAGSRSDLEKHRFVESLHTLGRHPNSAVLCALVDGPRRFNELIAELTNVPEPAVSAGLRELDSDGLVVRRVDPGPPLRVLYELTKTGIELGPALRALASWCARST